MLKIVNTLDGGKDNWETGIKDQEQHGSFKQKMTNMLSSTAYQSLHRKG